MKRIYLYVFFICLCSLRGIALDLKTCSSDTSDNRLLLLEPSETYILIFEFDTILYKAHCSKGCLYPENTSKECVLVKGKIKEVKFMGDTTVYNKNELQQVEYFVIADKDFKTLHLHQEYLVSASNSSTKSYVIFKKIRFENNANYYYGYFHMYGLNICYKRNLLQFLHLQKSYAKNTKMRKNEFTEFISKLK